MNIESLQIPPAKINQFKKKGIDTIEDLINFLPRRYLDYRFPKTYSEFVDGDNISVIATVMVCNWNDTKGYWKATVRDETMKAFDIYWFGNVYGVGNLEPNQKYVPSENV